MNKLVAVIVLSMCLLNGCKSTDQGPRIVAENEQFWLINPRQEDNFKSLAQEFLGSSQYGSVIRRYNPPSAVNHANFVAIPKTNSNQSAVFYNGYQKIPVLCYHQFTTSKTSKNRMVVTQDAFRAQMSFLHENNYQVITLKEASEFINSERELPDNAVVITIDDGYRSFKEIALPILKQYNFPSTMFVYPAFVGAGVALSWRDIKQLITEPLVDIQSHSTTHASLSRDPRGENSQQYKNRLKKEVDLAAQAIKKRTAHQVTHFAYPYGNTSETLVEMLKERDYELAVTVQRGSNPAFASPFLLNRTMIYGGDSLSRFKQALDTFEKRDLR